jgi:hypothetical protein
MLIHQLSDIDSPAQWVKFIKNDECFDQDLKKHSSKMMNFDRGKAFTSSMNENHQKKWTNTIDNDERRVNL